LLQAAIKNTKKDVADIRSLANDNDKWLPTSEVHRLKEEQYLKQQKECDRKKKQQESARLQSLANFLSVKQKKAAQFHGAEADLGGSFDSSLKDTNDYGDDDDEDLIPPIPITEIIRRLRKKGEPSCLFGETPMQRYRRLCGLDLAHHEDEFMGGQQNEFLHILEGRKRRRREEHDDDDDDFDHPQKATETPKKAAHTREGGASPTSDANGTKTSTDTKNTRVEASEGIREDKVREWIRCILKEWERDLHQRSEASKKTSDGKVASATYRQTRKDLKPLIRKLKHRGLEEDVLDKLYKMAVFCEKLEYRAAHDLYIQLSIGNAAWPMGVTMVGIHERAGRSKIFTSEIAHILNDETTRKYIQMFKRLMSYCQKRFPANPSQMVTLSTIYV